VDLITTHVKANFPENDVAVSFLLCASSNGSSYLVASTERDDVNCYVHKTIVDYMQEQARRLQAAGVLNWRWEVSAMRAWARAA
jgi:hypothetical protein